MPVTEAKEIESFSEWSSAAHAAVKEHGFDRTALRKILRGEITDTSVDILITWAIDFLIEDAIRKCRSTALHSAIPVHDGGNGFRSLVVTLMYAEIRPGLLMKDATKEDLIDKARELRAHARGTMHHAYYLETVASRLKKGERVGQTMSDKDLSQISKLANKKAEELIP